jgi:hypothetical protein
MRCLASRNRRLDSYLGGARTLISPGQPARRRGSQLAIESLQAWKEEQGIDDELLTRKPEDLGLRTTYLATGPVTEANVPDNHCDFAAPFA